jgi:CO/xanthine dehydrogenase FAD-binding subunit
MITAYHRPKTLDEALTLLNQPNTLPLGGGTLLSQPQPFDLTQGKSDPVEVVDLQALGLNTIKKSGNNLEIGATATLQQLLESEHCSDVLKSALKLEAPLNIRNAATVAGTIVSCDGRSTFATVLLALDTRLEIRDAANQSPVSSLGEFLPFRPRGLITFITIPLNVKLAFEYVARTPADKPLVCVALAQWNSGRTRLAVGGYGKSPMLAMDGTESAGVEPAARTAFYDATDEWASAEYRMEVGATLAKRCLEKF